MALLKGIVVRLLLWLTIFGSLYCTYAASQYVSHDLPQMQFNDASPYGYAAHMRYDMMQKAIILAPALLSLLSLAGLLMANGREARKT